MSTSKAAACLGLLLLVQCVSTLIIPEELPTVLSLIYSNIPPIKKGTDSRLGVGFRLGEHADFQILFEVGPQKETQPIGNGVDSKRKRAAMMYSALKGDFGPWAQSVAKYQMEDKLKKMLEKYKTSQAKQPKLQDNPAKSTDTKGGGNEWLSKWSQGLDVNPEDSATIEQVTTRKNLPNVNRMRVVDSHTNANSQNKNAQTDLKILKELFGNNANETRSVR